MHEYNVTMAVGYWTFITIFVICITLVEEIATEDVEKAAKYKAALKTACDMALGGAQ